MRCCLRSTVALLLLCLILPVHASDFETLSRLLDKGFRISAEARLLDEDRVLAAIEPQRLLSPASVSKSYLAAAALDRWGPQHRFTTRLVSTREPDSHGVLQGDLILDGGGDPALTSEDLWRLVQRLYQAGVRRVNGRLLVSQWRFGPVECLTYDRCEARERTRHAYSALLSSAGVNYGNWCVNVAPADTPGEPAIVTDCDSQVAILAIDNGVVTRPDNSGTEISAVRITRDGRDVMRLSGQISTNAHPRDIYRASADPADQMALTLLAMLDQAGIAVSGGADTTQQVPSSEATTLAAVDGKPLQELLLRTMNYSNNYMADMLALNLVEAPRADLRSAGAAIEAFVAGIPEHGPVTLFSGSGLTPENRTSARGANALLDSLYHRPSLFPSFVATLQSPDNGVMRFIRRGSDTFQRHVMLKTGTLNQPVTVRAVSGYFRTARGRWGAFSVLINGTDSTPYLSWSEVLDPLAVDLERMIDNH
ncbi:D-alanyl-D-alanine carboxypeptidase/D-alanyl-D-alanine-endopeptidase [Halomonas icarae]|nr:D-alanyl-D-alanine carboxypeptidase/D-alanyl-D-alanine-endopeptidase [Halomonas icarae]MDR5903380.1 D-alanyl-D-alanine carboxypeptidase/D-alanyl-D-alanine-endopeptidase [Halomonas icarae]